MLLKQGLYSMVFPQILTKIFCKMTENKIANLVEIAKNTCWTLHSRLAGRDENDRNNFEMTKNLHSNLDI